MDGIAIAYDRPITFGRAGNARTLNSRGIDFEEDGDHSWTCESTAELDIPLPLFQRNIALKIAASPFLVPDTLRSQQVFVFINSLFVGCISLDGFATNEFRLARLPISEQEIHLALAIPTAISPKKLGIGNDMRKLGIYLSSVEFSLSQ